MSSVEVNSRCEDEIPRKLCRGIDQVYICVYFDGTSNNMYHPENKRREMSKSDNDNWELQTEQASKAHIIDTDRKSKSGNGNDKYSNVAILYSLSKDYNGVENQSQTNGTGIGYSIYVEGSGAMPILGADVVGSGFGVGKAGVVALVSKAIRLINDYLSSSIPLSRRENVELHFALFGFSRGSTCARVLTHLIARENSSDPLPREKEFAQYLECRQLYKNGRVTFLEGFNKNKTTVDFLGIYDTVSSIGFLQKEENITNYGINNFVPIKQTHSEGESENATPSGGLVKSLLNKIGRTQQNTPPKEYVIFLHNFGPKVWGDAYLNFHRDNVTEYGLYFPSGERVLNAFHICALDEFRENFALVNLGNNLNDKCSELFVPGCHSDIGGGYMDDDILVDYSLRSSINEIPTAIIKGNPGKKPNTKSEIVPVTIGGLTEAGWFSSQNLDLGQMLLTELRGKLNRANESERADLVKFRRFVSEGYSNITMQAMLNRAISLKFGLGKWPERFHPFGKDTSHIRFALPKIKMKERILTAAEEVAGGKRMCIVPQTDQEYAELRNTYLHFTSTDKRYSGLMGNPTNIADRVTAVGANLGNPPNWKYIEIESEKYYVLCRLMYNGDCGARSLATLYDLNF